MESSENTAKKESLPELKPGDTNGARILLKKKNIDVEGVFEIDGLESSQQQAFDESDEERHSTDSEDETPPANITRKHGAKHYATSLPIKVPVWTFNHDDKSDDDKVASFEGPEQIAESIKALAMSVRDGTEMFGDLPRRRLNTGDLVKSRPI